MNWSKRRAVQDAEGYVDGSKDYSTSDNNQLYSKVEYDSNKRTITDAEGNKEEGDTLRNIALDIYGNKSATEALANMNDIGDIDEIYEGQRLILPGVAIDNSSNGYMQPGFVDGAREVPDAYIAATIVGTVALEAGGLEALSTAGSSAYAAADKAFEKGYYWASDKLGKFSNFLSDKIGRVFNKGTGSTGADNIATGSKLNAKLTFEEANSVFTKSGTLKPEVIANSKSIIPGSELNNPNVIKVLTSNGSNINDWAKMTTKTFKSPSGDFQVHFYQNLKTGIASIYEMKVKFNR